MAGILASRRCHCQVVLLAREEYELLQWLCFAEFIDLCFGPPIRSNPLGELKELHCTGTVDDYQCQFLSLLCHCDGLAPEHEMNLFTTDLGEPMQLDIEMQRPAALQNAMSLARAFERCANADTAMASFPVTCSQQRSQFQLTGSI